MQQEFQGKVPVVGTHVCSQRLITETSAILPIQQLYTVSSLQGTSADPVLMEACHWVSTIQGTSADSLLMEACH
jgi:hypothetical protein